MVGFVFGYTSYEAFKLEDKLKGSVTEILIKELPADLKMASFQTKEPFVFKKSSNKKSFSVVHFWATWCAPCEIEFPELVKFINLMKNEKNNVTFYLVAVNDDDKKVKKFLAKFDLNAENVVLLEDKNSDYQKFGSYKLPETFVFDSSFQTVRKFEGQQAWTQNTIVNYFKSL